MLSANLSAIFYLISGVLFILALRGLSSPETSRQANICEKINCRTQTRTCQNYLDRTQIAQIALRRESNRVIVKHKQHVSKET